MARTPDRDFWTIAIIIGMIFFFTVGPIILSITKTRDDCLKEAAAQDAQRMPVNAKQSGANNQQGAMMSAGGKMKVECRALSNEATPLPTPSGK